MGLIKQCFVAWGICILCDWAGFAVDAAPSTPAPPSLRAALQSMPESALSSGQVLLTVGAENVALPEDAKASPKMLTSQGIVAQYKRLSISYGSVLAIAPPTMTLLNTDPNLADLPLAQLLGHVPVPVLIKTLSESQLTKLGAEGLELQDLTPEQQELFKAVLPHPFEIVPNGTEPFDGSQADEDAQNATSEERNHLKARMDEDYKRNTQTLDDDLVLRTGRLKALLGMTLYYKGGDAQEQMSASDWPDTKYFISDKASDGANHGPKLNAYLKTSAPNTLKRSELSWQRPELSQVVSLDGVSTVDDLVVRLARATHLELYADKSYGKRTVLIKGDLPHSPRASDLMQALCLCVTGAWRHVGPAWVLTDDIAGVGARQQRIAFIIHRWGNRLNEFNDLNEASLNKFDWLRKFSGSGSSQAFIFADMLASLRKLPGSKSNYNWDALPEETKNEILASFKKAGESQKFLAGFPGSQIGFKLFYVLDSPLTGLLIIGPELSVPDQNNQEANNAPPEASEKRSSILKPTGEIRGVFVAPTSPAEAIEIVDRFAALGFNALFCEVFRYGQAYFPSAVSSPVSQDKAQVIQAALEEGRKKKVAVYAVVGALLWDNQSINPVWSNKIEPDVALDGAYGSPDSQARSAARWASPYDPKVRAILPALVSELAQTQGLAGVALWKMEPPGYDGKSSVYSLGYHLSNRLAYLRSQRRDPIDTNSLPDGQQISLYYDGSGVNWTFDISLPGFQANQDPNWDPFLRRGVTSLLTQCVGAAHRVAPMLPVLVWFSVESGNQKSDTVTILDGRYAEADRKGLSDIPAIVFTKIKPSVP